MSELVRQFEDSIETVNDSSEIFESMKVESVEIEENEGVIKNNNNRIGDRDLQKRRKRRLRSNGQQIDAHTIKFLRHKIMRLQAENRRLRDVIRACRYINRMSQKAERVFEAFNLLHKKALPNPGGPESTRDDKSFAMNDSHFTADSHLRLISSPLKSMAEPNLILSTSIETIEEDDIDKKSLAVRKDIFEDKPIDPFENLPHVNGVQSSIDGYKVQCESTANQATELANTSIQNSCESLETNGQNGSQITTNLAELMLDCPAHSTWGQPTVPEKEMALDRVNLGGILVFKDSLEKCNTTKVSKLTINLMTMLFTPDEMADSSLTGKPSNIHKSRTPDQVRPKEPINPLKTKALFAYVKEKFPGVKDQEIKNALKSKLKYEAQKKYGVGFTKPKQNRWKHPVQLNNGDLGCEENREIFYPPMETQYMTKTECCFSSNDPLM